MNSLISVLHQFAYIMPNGRAHIRHQCSKTVVLSGHRFVISSGVEKNEPHLNID